MKVFSQNSRVVPEFRARIHFRTRHVSSVYIYIYISLFCFLFFPRRCTYDVRRTSPATISLHRERGRYYSRDISRSRTKDRRGSPLERTIRADCRRTITWHRYTNDYSFETPHSLSLSLSRSHRERKSRALRSSSEPRPSDPSSSSPGHRRRSARSLAARPSVNTSDTALRRRRLLLERPSRDIY